MTLPTILKPRLPTNPVPASLTAQDLRSEERHSDLLVHGLVVQDLEADRFEVGNSVVRAVRLSNCRLPRLELTDTFLDGCEASNCAAADAILHRVELRNCRFIGIDVGGSSLNHVLVTESSMELGNFRFASFKRVIFENCMLRESEFQGADLRGVRFRGCDLRKAQLSTAKLEGADLRGSQVDQLGFAPGDLAGVIIDSVQLTVLGWSLAAGLGIVVRDDEPDQD